MFGVSHSFSYFTFLKSIGIGYLIGAFYLLFKFIRILGIKQAPFVFLQDLLFFTFSSVAVFLFVYEINAGIFRFYIICGIIIGFLLFYLVPGSLLNSISEKQKGNNNTIWKKKKK